MRLIPLYQRLGLYAQKRCLFTHLGSEEIPFLLGCRGSYLEAAEFMLAFRVFGENGKKL